MSRHSRALGALSSILVGASLVVLSIAGPVSAEPDYPSWDDVLAARDNQEQTQAAITEIEGILGQLQTQAAELERDAQIKGEAYSEALAALTAAQEKSDRLKAQADAAQDRADGSAAKAAQLAAQLGRTGGGDLTVALLVSTSPDDLLDQLGAMDQVSRRTIAIYTAAVVDRNAAESLNDQAEVAESERAEAEDVAGAALDAAQSAADAANARLAEQQAASAQLYEQLATLKNTTAATEQAYLDGLAAQPPAPQQPSEPPPGNPGPSDPGPTPGGGAAGAIAFAYAQLGDAYAWGGSGPDAWDCSGLTQAAYASVGVYIGAHLVSSQYYTMANQGRLVWYENMQPGDLIYYANGGYPGGGFYHMALYVGGGQMIEAPRDGVPVRLAAVRYWDMLDYVGRPTG